MFSSYYECLRGAIDMHVHGAPDVFRSRVMDEFELAKLVHEVGMRGIVLKSHHTLTADRAYYIRKMVPDVEVFGGIALNYAVGGLNPYAVKSAVKYPFCKIVWMPTLDATNYVTKRTLKGPPYYNEPMKGISLFDGDYLLPEAEEILDLIACHKIILASGHLSLEETTRLVQEAKKRGVEKIIVNHPELQALNFTVDDQKELATMGAYLEHTFAVCSHMRMHATPKEVAEAIKAVGAQNCIMATDAGALFNPLPVEGLRLFVNSMLAYGITESEIELMIKKNPAKLLDLPL